MSHKEERFTIGERVKVYNDTTLVDGLIGRIYSDSQGNYCYDIETLDRLAFIAIGVCEDYIHPIHCVKVYYKKTVRDGYTGMEYNRHSFKENRILVAKLEDSLRNGDIVSLKIEYEYASDN